MDYLDLAAGAILRRALSGVRIAMSRRALVLL
jgi:hypothetical protein